MMLIRIIIMLLIALFVESRQEAFGQTTDTLSLSDKVIRTASFATGFRGEIWQNPALYYYYTPYTWTRLDVNGAYHDKGKASLIERMESRNGYLTLEAASKLGLGSREYELIEIN